MSRMSARSVTQTPSSDPASAPTAQSRGRDSAGMAARLNWLRAGVLGANDGIVSVAATVVAVAAATSTVTPVLLAGVASVLAGMLSMALGEYVSVSSAADSQRSVISQIRRQLSGDRAGSVGDLRQAYLDQGLTPETAQRVAEELTAHDAVGAHLSARFHLAEDEVVNPWHAALASGLSFLVGSLLPMATILLSPIAWRVPVTFVSVVIALALTGGFGAKLGDAPVGKAVIRVVVGGILALAITWLVGNLLGVAVG